MRARAHEMVAARYSIDGTAARYRDLFDDVMAA
jgi:hypothetical protein